MSEVDLQSELDKQPAEVQDEINRYANGLREEIVVNDSLFGLVLTMLASRLNPKSRPMNEQLKELYSIDKKKVDEHLLSLQKQIDDGGSNFFIALVLVAFENVERKPIQ